MGRVARAGDLLAVLRLLEAHLSNAATVFELWFGGGPAPVAREVNRAVWHGQKGFNGVAILARASGQEPVS